MSSADKNLSILHKAAVCTARSHSTYLPIQELHFSSSFFMLRFKKNKEKNPPKNRWQQLDNKISLSLWMSLTIKTFIKRYLKTNKQVGRSAKGKCTDARRSADKNSRKINICPYKEQLLSSPRHTKVLKPETNKKIRC